MDADLLQEIDAHISNIGTDKCWKREVGDHVIWFSPISFLAQGKVNETLSNTDLGSNIIAETKRVTLAHAIVGIDDFDLRPYRSGNQFQIPHRSKPGKTLKVDLSTYIHTKLGLWSNDYGDVIFDVFADLMQSYENENKNSVKFENAKDPMDELAELESRAAALRVELNLSQMTEADREDLVTPEETSEEVNTSDQEGFDPFKVVQREDDPIPENPSAVQNIPIPQPVPQPAPVQTMSPIEEAMRQKEKQIEERRKNPIKNTIGAKISSPDQPVQAMPSIDSGTVEERESDKVPVPPPSIDSRVSTQNKNPRFQKSQR